MFGFKNKKDPVPPQIEFLCRPEDKGVIAEPYQARDKLPDWFRKVPAIDKDILSPANNGITVKRCMPFLDAMSAGWILPLAATVRLEIKDEGRTVDAGWEFDRTMVGKHAPFQVAGHPASPRPPCKMHNYWTIRTPPGWSCLFVPPLNRGNVVLEVMSGVVDTDEYASLIHFPFFAHAPDGIYTLEKGTPLVQVIPFQRTTTYLGAVVRAEEPDEGDARKRILRNTKAGDGWYRQTARAKR